MRPVVLSRGRKVAFIHFYLLVAIRYSVFRIKIDFRVRVSHGDDGGSGFFVFRKPCRIADLADCDEVARKKGDAGCGNCERQSERTARVVSRSAAGKSDGIAYDADRKFGSHRL